MTIQMLEIVLWIIIIIKISETRDRSSEANAMSLEKDYHHNKKPSIKTITTKYGQTYDCVDFYEQPGFAHPLLKNHSFHPDMRPSFDRTKATFVNAYSQDDEVILDSSNFKLKDGGCPKGTVPIRRMSRVDLVEIKEFTEQYASRTRSKYPPNHQSGTNYAVLETSSNPRVLYNGVGGILSVHNPIVRASQSSSGALTVQHGDDRIEVGWMVNPSINKDNLTHLYQHIDAGTSHCFNAFCPGFISVRQDMPIDVVLEPSIYGKQTRAIILFIQQDPKNGNWWLQINKEGVVIGFWPKQIFTGLASSANYVTLGGETYSPVASDPVPPMGTGVRPPTWAVLWNFKKLAFVRDFFVLDARYKQIELKEAGKYITNKDHYKIVDVGHLVKLGHVIVYGGNT